MNADPNQSVDPQRPSPKDTAMGNPIKVLLVDDSVVVRGLVARVVDNEPDLEVISTAPNGAIGVEKVRSLNPDLVVLDIEMPVMTGLEAIVEIRKTHPKTPILMFSTLTKAGAAATVKALTLGATDYSTKPTDSGGMVEAMKQVEAELVSKIRKFGRLGSTAGGERVAAAPTRAKLRPTPKTHGSIDAVVVGSSTGGPVALENVLSSIVRPLPVPLLITQHMPPTFTKALADRLDRKVPSAVHEAHHDQLLKPGECYIAPGGHHLSVRRQSPTDVRVVISDGEPIHSCKPSVEPLFESAVDVYGSNLLAVMLTGMGNDGIDGMRRIASLGCDVIAQDEETSVVWGMPRAVVDAGLATEVLPLESIGPRIQELAGNLRHMTRRAA